MSGVRAAICTSVLTVCAVAAVCVLAVGGGGGSRQRLLPRYTSEKEIRGPAFHVHHNIRPDHDLTHYQQQSVRNAGVVASQGQRRKMASRHGDGDSPGLLGRLFFKPAASAPASEVEGIRRHPKLVAGAQAHKKHSQDSADSFSLSKYLWWPWQDSQHTDDVTASHLR